MWNSLKNYSTYSLLKSTIKPDLLVNRVVEQGHSALAITEKGNLFSSVKFYKLCKEKKIKPILGCDFYVGNWKDGGRISNLTVLAKNEKGWKALIKSVSESNKAENFDKQKEIPTITEERLAEILEGNCIVYTGGISSNFACNLFNDKWSEAIKCRDYNVCRKLVRSDWENFTKEFIERHKKLFGESNFFFEVQPVQDSIECCSILTKLVRWAGEKFKVKVIGTANPHYLDKETAEDQRILLCSDENATLNNVELKIEQNQKFLDLLFFRGSYCYFPSNEQAISLFKSNEIENVEYVCSLCEEYNILNQPKIPEFICPDGLTQPEYLKKLCNDGWQKKIVGKIPKEKHPEYLERVRHEMKVIDDAGLQGYFLVVLDIVNYAKNQGWLTGTGRGSAAGCLISHLIGITNIDPIEHDLLFSRFYNSGRNVPGRIAMPDIDCDFPKNKRELVIKYIQEKYGIAQVAYIATFGRLQGRASIKDVLRARERCSYEEMNRISEFIPDEAKISDELQAMKEAGEEPSILYWALRDHKDKLKQWCFIGDDGKLQGDYAKDFELAMRLEGLKRQLGKHASAIVVSKEPLDTFCPLLYDKNTGEHILGFDMHDAEALGCLKMDILSTAVLEHLMDMISIITTGDYPDD